jgi:virginiamycin A acetyltransferase
VRRTFLKVAELVGLWLVLPLVAAWRLRLVTYFTAGQLLSLLPGDLGMLLRRAWYRLTLAKCGRGLTVEFGSVIHKQGARIGNHCYIGEYNRIGMVDIEHDFMSSSHVAIMSGTRQHAFTRRDIPIRLQPSVFERVAIGADVWIGAGAIVGADVAAHTIIAAGGVVTKKFDEWQILAGVPASPIRERP